MLEMLSRVGGLARGIHNFLQVGMGDKDGNHP
jgi:hypothetical protein